MADQTWHRREAVLLEALAELEVEGKVGDSSNIAEQSGLEGPDVGYGLQALADAVPPFVVIDGDDQGSIATRVPYYVSVRLGERGRRYVRQWPAEEETLETFLEPSPSESRSRATRTSGRGSSGSVTQRRVSARRS